MTSSAASCGISALRLMQLQAMIRAGTSNGFYDWPEWEHTRAAVLELDHWECQICRGRGRYRRAVLVHHVAHLKDRPDLALSVFDPDTGKRQLVSLCRACHVEQHPERQRKWRWTAKPPANPVTIERWD